MGTLPKRLRDELAFHLLMALWVWSYLMLEIYHRVASAQLPTAVLALVWAVSTWLLRRARAPGPHTARWPRWAVSAACLLAMADRLIGHGTGLALLGCAAAGLLAAISLSRWFDPPHPYWAKARSAMVVGSLLFATLPQVWAAWSAPKVDWLSSASSGSLTPAAQPAEPRPAQATVIFLFDEWNASAAQPVVDVLKKRGFVVDVQAVRPVADGTLKVIPQLFLDRSFEQARPCSTTAVCSNGNVLDFARIQAGRADVDVVGFFHPYCAIRGLRSCFRGTVPVALFRPDLWRCALWRRTGWPESVTLHDCDLTYGRGWETMREDVLAGVRNAPVWRQGGILFAHVPLPHPPASPSNGNLRQDYAENLQRTARFVDDLIVRSQMPGGAEPRFILFSDHPLRPKVWCTGYWPYTARGCRETTTLDDFAVPVVVASRAGDIVPRIQSNGQVFDLLKALRWE